MPTRRPSAFFVAGWRPIVCESCSVSGTNGRSSVSRPLSFFRCQNGNTIFLLDYIYYIVHEIGCRWFLTTIFISFFTYGYKHCIFYVALQTESRRFTFKDKINFMDYLSILYCSSVTASSHSFEPSFPGTSMAR